MKTFKFPISFLTAAFALSLTGLSHVHAQTDAEKLQLSEQAITLCQSAAEKRYGENAVKSVAKKAKWSKGLRGAAVKMKIKPKAKKANKYNCVVGVDQQIKFYKA